MTPVGARGLVEVSLDGEIWDVVLVADSSDTWMPVEVNLRPWLESRLYVRLSPIADAEPGESTLVVWNVENIAVTINGVAIAQH